MRVARLGLDLESNPMKPKPTPRIDSSTATRLDGVAAEFLKTTGAKLNGADRGGMIIELESRRGVVVTDRSDDYVAARYAAMRADVVPADGMAPGSTVRAEVLGGARELRQRTNSYLNQAFGELLKEQRVNGGVSSLPNGCDVEDRARQLAKLDPKGLFTDGKNV